MFGAGYLVLSQIPYGALVAIAVASIGAVAKVLIYSSGKLGGEATASSNDASSR